MSSGQVTTSDGVTLRYLEQGSGLVMVPGWSQTAAQFKHQIEGLSHRYRVIALDMRGHGDSDKPDHGYRISRFAEDLHDALSALDLTEINLLAHSLGCAVVWCYLNMFGAERLAKLILVDQSPFLTANPAWSQFEREAAESALTPVQRRDPVSLYEIDNLLNAVTDLAGQHGEEVTRQFVGGLFTNRVSEEEKAWAIDRMLMLPRAYGARLLYDNALQSWFDVVTRITRPTLLISSAARQARFPGSRSLGCTSTSPDRNSKSSKKTKAASISSSWRTPRSSTASSLASMLALHSASVRRRSATTASQLVITSVLVMTGRRPRSFSVKFSASTWRNRSACQGDSALAKASVSRKARCRSALISSADHLRRSTWAGSRRVTAANCSRRRGLSMIMLLKRPFARGPR